MFDLEGLYIIYQTFDTVLVIKQSLLLQNTFLNLLLPDGIFL